MTRPRRGPTADPRVRALGVGELIDKYPHVFAVESEPIQQGQNQALRALSEAQFQRIVVAHLRSRGWLVFIVPDMRKTLAGLPDLLCLHIGVDMLLAWELKRESGKPTPIQRAVLALLDAVPGIDARVVRPSDWEALRDSLDCVVEARR